MQSTLYALSVCMNGRASHFIMQTAIAYSATDGGVQAVEKHHGIEKQLFSMSEKRTRVPFFGILTE